MPRFDPPPIKRRANTSNLQKAKSTKSPKVAPFCFVCTKSMTTGGRFITYIPAPGFARKVKLCGSCSDYFDSKLHLGLSESDTLEIMHTEEMRRIRRERRLTEMLATASDRKR